MKGEILSSNLTLPRLTTDEIEEHYAKLARMPILHERKLQRLKPADKGTYAFHTAYFLETFLATHKLEEQMTTWDGITLIGNANYHDVVIDEIRGDKRAIEETAKRKVKNVTIFLGNGVQMNTLFRSIGAQYMQIPESYPLAIAGPSCCFLNIDEYKNTGNFYTSRQVGSRRHEFRHAAVDSVLDNITNYPNSSRISITVHEALGGPDEEYWRRRDTPRIKANFEGLTDNNFYRWLHAEESKIGFNGNYFDSPIVQSFYIDYVNKQGDFSHWFNYAVQLGKQAKLM